MHRQPRTGLRLLGEGQVNLQGDLKSNFNTYERTNVLRPVLTDVDHLSAVDARAHIEGFTSIGEVISDGIRPDGTRHEVTHTGERAEIPMYVRSAVWHRDRGRCELCGWQRFTGPWHLDHITPWSAGGSDSTENLRVLCEPHNLARSNYVDPTERTRRPATWWCLNCMSKPWRRARNMLTERVEVICPIHAWSQACAVRRALTWIAENDAEDWWTRDTIDPESALTVAHCAHCGAPGLTDRPL